MSGATMETYPLVRAWSRMMHSFPYYIEQQVELARREHGPPDAVYRNSSGRWVRIGEVKSPATLRALRTTEREGEA